MLVFIHLTAHVVETVSLQTQRGFPVNEGHTCSVTPLFFLLRRTDPCCAMRPQDPGL